MEGYSQEIVHVGASPPEDTEKGGKGGGLRHSKCKARKEGGAEGNKPDFIDFNRFSIPPNRARDFS